MSDKNRGEEKKGNLSSMRTWFKTSQNNRRGIYYRQKVLKTALMTNFALLKNLDNNFYLNIYF